MSVAARFFPGLRVRPGITRARVVFLVLIILLAIIVFLSVDKGAVEISLGQCAAIVARRLGFHLPFAFDSQQEATLLSIRLPRVVLGLMVGAALGISGTAMQGLFRNPLADPSLIGISSGAALAATIVIVVGDLVAFNVPTLVRLMALPVAAFAGGLVTTVLVYRLATIAGQTIVATLLLAGIAINALSQAFSGLVTYFATDTQIRSITFWKLGSLGGATWNSVLIAGPFILIPIALFPILARDLNALLLGEAEAGHLGVNAERVKRLSVIFVAMAVGAAVAVSGIITFVGLVVPHVLRLILGPDHRRLLPASALLGAILLLASDLVARTLVAPAELPIGILTALIGAPFFIWLLLRDRKWRVIH